MSVLDAINRTVNGESTVGGEVERVIDVVREHWFSYMLFAPVLIFLAGLLWFPLLKAIWMSLHEWSFTAQQTNTFVGLENYTYLFTWDAFYTSLKATLAFGLITFVQLVVAIVASLVFVQMDRFKALLSGLYLLPYTMPPVVTGTIWLYLLAPQNGPIMRYLTNWGVIESPIFWDVDGTLALIMVTGVLAWTFWPFMFLIISATMESIPQAHYESAQVYGANRVQTFFEVTLPQIKSAIMVAVTIRVVWNLAKISQPFQLTQGGPGYETAVLGVLLYRFAYLNGQFGLGSAVGVVLLLLSMGFAVVFVREFEKNRGGV